ncbi:MAG: hypothetical protein PHD43_17105 [Methylococcales bacterium]|nr:hypothetical protein [Methylococcales bacterium]
MFTANTFLKSASSAALISLQQAANDPAVKADASADLYSAEKLLQHAETSWQEDHDVEETDHLSYFRHRRICYHQTFRALTTSIV